MLGGGPYAAMQQPQMPAWALCGHAAKSDQDAKLDFYKKNGDNGHPQLQPSEIQEIINYNDAVGRMAGEIRNDTSAAVAAGASHHNPILQQSRFQHLQSHKVHPMYVPFGEQRFRARPPSNGALPTESFFQPSANVTAVSMGPGSFGKCPTGSGMVSQSYREQLPVHHRSMDTGDLNATLERWVTASPVMVSPKHAPVPYEIPPKMKGNSSFDPTVKSTQGVINSYVKNSVMDRTAATDRVVSFNGNKTATDHLRLLEAPPGTLSHARTDRDSEQCSSLLLQDKQIFRPNGFNSPVTNDYVRGTTSGTEQHEQRYHERYQPYTQRQQAQWMTASSPRVVENRDYRIRGGQLHNPQCGPQSGVLPGQQSRQQPGLLQSGTSQPTAVMPHIFTTTTYPSLHDSIKRTIFVPPTPTNIKNEYTYATPFRSPPLVAGQYDYAAHRPGTNDLRSGWISGSAGHTSLTPRLLELNHVKAGNRGYDVALESNNTCQTLIECADIPISVTPGSEKDAVCSSTVINKPGKRGNKGAGATPPPKTAGSEPSNTQILELATVKKKPLSARKKRRARKCVSATGEAESGPSKQNKLLPPLNLDASDACAQNVTGTSDAPAVSKAEKSALADANSVEHVPETDIKVKCYSKRSRLQNTIASGSSKREKNGLKHRSRKPSAIIKKMELCEDRLPVIPALHLDQLALPPTAATADGAITPTAQCGLLSPSLPPGDNPTRLPTVRAAKRELTPPKNKLGPPRRSRATQGLRRPKHEQALSDSPLAGSPRPAVPPPRNSKKSTKATISLDANVAAAIMRSLALLNERLNATLQKKKSERSGESRLVSGSGGRRGTLHDFAAPDYLQFDVSRDAISCMDEAEYSASGLAAKIAADFATLTEDVCPPPELVSETNSPATSPAGSPPLGPAMRLDSNLLRRVNVAGVARGGREGVKTKKVSALPAHFSRRDELFGYDSQFPEMREDGGEDIYLERKPYGAEESEVHMLSNVESCPSSKSQSMNAICGSRYEDFFSKSKKSSAATGPDRALVLSYEDIRALNDRNFSMAANSHLAAILAAHDGAATHESLPERDLSKRHSSMQHTNKWRAASYQLEAPHFSRLHSESSKQQFLVESQTLKPHAHQHASKLFSVAASEKSINDERSDTADEVSSDNAPVYEHVYSLRIQTPKSPHSGKSSKDNVSSREVQVIEINKDPKVYVLPEFLTARECNELMAAAQAQGWSMPQAASADRASSADARECRESQSTLCSARLPKCGSVLCRRLEQRVAAAARVDASFVEAFVVVRYQPGQFFKEHHDGFSRPKTVLIYLNDVEEGGETEFPHLNFRVTPQQGTAVMWSNVLPNKSPDWRLKHASRPPEGSWKYVVNCFINDEKQTIFPASSEDMIPRLPIRKSTDELFRRQRSDPVILSTPSSSMSAEQHENRNSNQKAISLRFEELKQMHRLLRTQRNRLVKNLEVLKEEEDEDP